MDDSFVVFEKILLTVQTSTTRKIFPRRRGFASPRKLS